MSDVDTEVPAAPERRTDRRAPAGRVAVAVLVVLGLVGGWLHQGPLQPSVVGNPAGYWRPVPPDGVLVRTDLDVTGWPSVLLREVRDVPGAHVVDAWVVPDADDAAMGTPSSIEPADLALGPQSPGALPQRVEPGARPDLVVRWEITDCDALVEGSRPKVGLRSGVGIMRTQEFDALTGPAFDLQTLADAGICPG